MMKFFFHDENKDSDLSLRWVHMSESMVSHVADNLMKQTYVIVPAVSCRNRLASVSSD